MYNRCGLIILDRNLQAIKYDEFGIIILLEKFINRINDTIEC